MKELIEIQSKLKAPKGQKNTFGNYNYRSCEDILEAVKPLLKEQGCALILSDDIVAFGDRVYVRAVAEMQNSEKEKVSVSAYAREAFSKKGMDEAQITGAASSYARKYALNGLFCIDDNKDPDATNKHQDDEHEMKESIVGWIQILAGSDDKQQMRDKLLEIAGYGSVNKLSGKDLAKAYSLVSDAFHEQEGR